MSIPEVSMLLVLTIAFLLLLSAPIYWGLSRILLNNGGSVVEGTWKVIGWGFLTGTISSVLYLIVMGTIGEPLGKEILPTAFSIMGNALSFWAFKGLSKTRSLGTWAKIVVTVSALIGCLVVLIFWPRRNKRV